MEKKSPAVSIRFAFCSSVSLCGTNREHIFRLPKSSPTMACAVSLLMPNILPQSFLESVADLVPAFVELSRSFLRFCFSMADPNVAHPQSFPSLCESVWTIRKHGFPPVHLCQHFTRLRSCFPQFVVELDVFTLLHCAVTLPLTLTTFNWPKSVYNVGHTQSILCVDSPQCLWRIYRIRAHMRQVSVQIRHLSQNF